MKTTDSILFIAYFYPPASGVGLPGAQRIAKFLKYLKIDRIHVLTIKPELYPGYVHIASGSYIPIQREHVHYAGSFSLLSLLSSIRKWGEQSKGKASAQCRQRRDTPELGNRSQNFFPKI